MRFSKIFLSVVSVIVMLCFLCSCTLADFGITEEQLEKIISQLERGELDNIVSQLESEIDNITSQVARSSNGNTSHLQGNSDFVSEAQISETDTESAVSQDEISEEYNSSNSEVVSSNEIIDDNSTSSLQEQYDTVTDESVYNDYYDDDFNSFDDFDYSIYDNEEFSETESIDSSLQETNIHQIKTIDDLMEFANTVRCGHSYKGELVTLEADLDLAGIEWTPIGSYKKPFKGRFFANGHKISNLTITSLTEQMSDGRGGNSYVGFFGYAQDASISGLMLENVNISLSGTADTEYVQVGSVVGYMMAVNDGITLSKCKASGNINISIQGDRIVEIGGIAGGFDANYKDTFYNLYLVQSDVNITGEGFIYNMGGIAAILNSRDSDSSDSSIHDLIYKGNINDEKVKRSSVGGLFGIYNSGYRCNVKNCFVKLTLNRIGFNSYTELEPNQGIIIGDQCVSTSDLGLENIYGSVYFNEKSEEMSMVGRTHGKVYYKNCIETNEIPDDVEFEIKYWNLTDRSSPLFDLEYTK